MRSEEATAGARPGTPGPLGEFFRAETTGAFVLLAATAAALVWANTAGASYEALWHTDLGIRLGERNIVELDLRHWVNDALMALFFFVVGLEIKRELVDGELADRRKAALPVAAALGGMIVPSLVYLAFNAGGPGSRGWGIPIATDIAFALGALALFGRGAPSTLRLFLLSVAIADDVGSILVIAAFYTPAVQVLPVLAAAVLLGAILLLWRAQSHWSDPPLVVLMVAFWAATLASGIHPTIAGVVLALATPAGPVPHPSPAERLEHTLHPWTSYLVVPIFALANAGIALDGGAIVAAGSSPITLGIVTALVVGKLAGITGGTYVATRVRLGALPSGVRWRHIVAVGALAGIGYTVSLFIAALSFADAGELTTHAKVGILAGSALSMLLGGALLHLSVRR